MEQQEIATKTIPESQDVVKNESEGHKETTPSATTQTWWGGWISQAKEKSSSVLEAVKNDLNEITTAVTETFHVSTQQDDASTSQQPSTVNYMKQSISSFFETVSDALIPQVDEDVSADALDEQFSAEDAKLLEDLQNKDETYLEDPSKNTALADKYKLWLEIVEQENFTQQRVEKMLRVSPIINEKYSRLVPDTVSHMNFFKFYLFKRALLEDELEATRRRKEVVIAKQPETVAVVEKSQEELPVLAELPVLSKLPVKTTGSGDLDIANFELSEAEQAKLLEDYEQEIKEREKTKLDEIVAPIAPSKSSKNPPKSISVQSKGKSNKNVKLSQKQQKSTQQKAKGNDGEKKTDESLKIQKDHFKQESESTTSDESWEKEFDL